jgi:hypothetical protein
VDIAIRTLRRGETPLVIEFAAREGGTRGCTADGGQPAVTRFEPG